MKTSERHDPLEIPSCYLVAFGKSEAGRNCDMNNNLKHAATNLSSAIIDNWNSFFW